MGIPLRKRIVIVNLTTANPFRTLAWDAKHEEENKEYKCFMQFPFDTGGFWTIICTNK